MNLESLSKEMSYALRHSPQDYGLEFDEHGWASMSVLIEALRKQECYGSLSTSDIEKMIATSEKTRFEIEGDRIRALYGHSVKERIEKEPARPPDVLFHGTTHKSIGSISEMGLISKERQYVHLSVDKKTALIVGKRRDKNPVLLIIDAKKACSDGVLFYEGVSGIWLADTVPPTYIQVAL